MPLTDIRHFTVQHLQVLDEAGVLDADLDPRLPDDTAVALYAAMLMARRADERMLKLQRQGRLGTFALGTGQEAATCAPALALGPRDWLATSFRELGARLVRGEPLVQSLRYHNGWEEGSVQPEGSRVLPIQVIVASQMLHAVGLAWASRQQGEPDTAALAFVGDGGTSQGDFYEALNFAGVWKAPVVFVIQNNGWAISFPRARQTAAETLAQKAIAAGIDGIQVDGNDALAMYRATGDALAKAKAGGGATLIEAVTYRMMMHTTADDPGRYRDEAEVEAWKRKDPLVRYRAYLQGRGLLDDAREAAVEEEVRGRIDEAVREMEATPAYAPDGAFDHVYGTDHEDVGRQRRAFLATLAPRAG